VGFLSSLVTPNARGSKLLVNEQRGWVKVDVPTRTPTARPALQNRNVGKSENADFHFSGEEINQNSIFVVSELEAIVFEAAKL
jgi:hypothetical protein